MKKMENAKNIFFPIVVGANDGRVVLCEVSGDIYHDDPGSLTLSDLDFMNHRKTLTDVRATEANRSGHHRLMDRRIIISATALETGHYTIDGSSCLLALVLMDRALRYPDTRTTRRVIATGAVGPDERIAAIPVDKASDYLAKIENVDWREGDILVCPAEGLTKELSQALDKIKERGVDVRPIRHLNELPDSWGSAKATGRGPRPETNTRRILWGLTTGAVLLIAYVGSRDTAPPPVPPTARLPFEAALGVDVLLEPHGGGAPARTLAGHVFTRGDRIGLELESSVAGQIAVFDTSAGASASPIPLAMAKIEGGRRLSLPTTGSWTLEGVSGAAQTLAVAFAACVDTACSPDFMTVAQAAVSQNHSNSTFSPPGRVALTSPDGHAAVARITLPY